MNIRFILLSLLLVIFIFSGCQPVPTDKTPIVIDGSTTMFDLSNEWAKAYMAKNPDSKINVEKNGTKKGIEFFIDGKCDIVETSRKLTTEEILTARQKGVEVDEFYAGFAVYSVAVNPKNAVEKLDEEQVKNIFLGKVTNWKDVGGADKPIEVLYREINPSDYDYFLEKFVNVSDNMDMNKLPSGIKILPSPEEIVKEISMNEAAIGYFLIQYQDDKTKSLALSEKGKNKFVKPSIEEASKGGYPVLRPYYMYINDNSKKPLVQYINFVYSDGVDIAKKFNFVPVPTKNGDIDRSVLFEYI